MTSSDPPPEIPPEVWERIERALRGLRFGTVELQVHDARVVRITRTEKILLELGGNKPKP